MSRLVKRCTKLGTSANFYSLQGLMSGACTNALDSFATKPLVNTRSFLNSLSSTFILVQ